MGANRKSGQRDEHFLAEALDPTKQAKLIQRSRLRRNIAILLFMISFVCIFICGFSAKWISTAIPLFLCTLSLVILTKYDTQLVFLRIIQQQQQMEKDEGC
jgi:uncharacterized membrane protein YjjP (DUF1212 family)